MAEHIMKEHNESMQKTAHFFRQHILHRSIYINIYLHDPDADV